MLQIGAHLSGQKTLEEGLKNLADMGGNVIQIFTASPHKLGLNEMKETTLEYSKLAKDLGIKVFIHAPYILNFCRDLIPKNKIFRIRLIKELEWAKKMGIEGIVLHFGNYLQLSEKKAEKNMVKSLKDILKNTSKTSPPILLETSSGEGTLIGKSIDAMKRIYDGLNKSEQKRIGFCIDTCHIFVAGYDLRKKNAFKEYIKEFDKKIGKNKIKLIHLNDSKTPFNERNDRHEGLTKGYIFNKDLGGNLESLCEIINISEKENIPIILETHDDYPAEIQKVKNLYKSCSPQSPIIPSGACKITNKKRYSSTLIMCGSGRENTQKLINVFSELRDYHKALGNIHQYRSYKNFVNKLSVNYTNNIDDIKNMEGVGKGILNKVNEFKKNGKIKILEDMKKNKKIKAMLELQSVFGIGIVLSKKLVEDGIYTIDQLNKSNIKLTTTQKFGLKHYKELKEKIKYKDALKYKKIIEDKLNKKVILSGGFRMGKQLSKDLDLIVVGGDNRDIDKLKDIIMEIIEKGKHKVLFFAKFKNKIIHIDLLFAPKNRLGTFLLYFGSGEGFSRKIRKIAREKGYKLNEFGLYSIEDGKEYTFEDEEGIFKFLGVDYLEPSSRF